MGLRTAVAGLAALLAAGAVAGCAGQDSSGSPQVVGSTAPGASAAVTRIVPPAISPRVRSTALGPSSVASAATLPRISVRRTGGFAGVEQVLDVRPDGGWTTSGVDRGGGPGQGRLPAAQQAELARLAKLPALAEEARQKPQPPQCADGYDYVLTVGPLTVAWVDCDPGRPPAASAIVDLLTAATPF